MLCVCVCACVHACVCVSVCVSVSAMCTQHMESWLQNYCHMRTVSLNDLLIWQLVYFENTAKQKDQSVTLFDDLCSYTSFQ